jgi:hypothetical protein
MTQVLKDLKSRSVPVIILSDANQFFIETVLNVSIFYTNAVSLKLT